MATTGQPSRKRIADDIRAGITEGRYPDRLLPAISTLAASYGCSETPVRQALEDLARDGLIVTRQGLRARVADNPPAPALHASTCCAHCRARLDELHERVTDLTRIVTTLPRGDARAN